MLYRSSESFAIECYYRIAFKFIIHNKYTRKSLFEKFIYRDIHNGYRYVFFFFCTHKHVHTPNAKRNRAFFDERFFIIIIQYVFSWILKVSEVLHRAKKTNYYTFGIWSDEYRHIR